MSESRRIRRMKNTGTGTVHIASGVLDASNLVDEQPIVISLQATLELDDGRCVVVELIDDDDRFIIGRDPQESDESEVVAVDPRVSRRHAAILVKDGEPWVEDLGSSNGTFVNEERITSLTALKNGDTIRMGHTRMVFKNLRSPE